MRYRRQEFGCASRFPDVGEGRSSSAKVYMICRQPDSDTDYQQLCQLMASFTRSRGIIGQKLKTRREGLPELSSCGAY